MSKTGGQLIDDGVDSMENELQNDTGGREGGNHHDGAKRPSQTNDMGKGIGLLDGLDQRAGSHKLLDQDI